jgi:hypothetical protein
LGVHPDKVTAWIHRGELRALNLAPPGITSSGAIYPSYLHAVLQRLELLKSLPNNWNSYGAVEISATAISTAKKVLLSLKDRFSSIIDKNGVRAEEIEPSAVSPLDDGGVQLEWRGTKYEVEIEIAPTGAIGFLLIEGAGASRKFIEGNEITFKRAIQLIGQVIRI